VTAGGRAALLVAAAFSLVAGILGGLARAGWGVPLPAATAHHGVLMIGGFLGTVISLERAVALGHPLALAAPLAAGAGAVLMLAGLDATLWLAAPALLVVISVALLRRQAELHIVLLLVGAAAWLAGNALHFAGASADATAKWWFAFLVLTIVAERLELARLMRPPPLARPLLAGLAALLLAGAAADAAVLYGAALAGLALWLGAFDIARRTVRTSGLARYAAVALLGGYAWLAVAGAAWMALPYAGFALRDAALHALGLGFVFSMIFAHAPIVLPAVARVRLAFTPFFYAPLALLQLSLVVRLAPAADAAAAQALAARQWGAALNAAAVLLFALTVLWKLLDKGK
jgi:hypothetical protein